MITGDEYYKTWMMSLVMMVIMVRMIFTKTMVKNMTQDNFLNMTSIKKLLNLWEV